MNMLAPILLSLSVVLASSAVAQTSETTKTYVIQQGAALPPSAVQAAEAMLAKGSGGFSVGTGLRGEVIDVVGPLQQGRERRVLKPLLHEPEARARPERREVRFLDRPRVVVGEAVDARDLVAVRQEARREHDGQAAEHRQGGHG